MLTIREKNNEEKTELETCIDGYPEYMKEIKGLCNRTIKSAIDELRRFSLFLVRRLGIITSAKLRRRVCSTELLIPAGNAGLTADSLVMAHQVRTISITRLIKLYGLIESQDLQERVCEALRVSLDLFTGCSHPASEKTVGTGDNTRGEPMADSTGEVAAGDPRYLNLEIPKTDS